MSKTAIFGGTEKFFRFAEASGANVCRVGTVREALDDPSFDSMMLLPDYENGMEKVPQMSLDDIEVLAKRKRQGFRVYAENYDAYNFYQASVFGYETAGDICHVSTQNFYAQSEFQVKLGGGRILQAYGAAYLPATVTHIDPYVKEKFTWLVMGEFLAASRPAKPPEAGCPQMLVRTGSVISALFSISRFDEANMRPNCRWKKAYAAIFSYILGVGSDAIEKAFEEVYPPLGIRYALDAGFDTDSWKNACETAFHDAARWHIDSGIVLGEHGEGGSLEMVMSNCGQNLYSNRRVDAGLYTGWTLYTAGKYFGDADMMKTGENVFRYFETHGQLEKGRQDGLFTWCYNQDAGPHDIYSIDCGRDGIALCNMYRELGDPEILDRIRRLADGFVRWMLGDLLAANHLIHDETPTDAPYQREGAHRTPAVYAEMSSFMVMAWKLTGEEKYLDTIVKIADRISAIFPNYEMYGHTTSSERARLLMLLLCVHLTGKRDYTDLINTALEYLHSLQLPCGGIYAEDNIYFERNIAHFEASISMPWEDDKISDQLYCVNNTLAALSIIRELPDDTKINKALGMEMFRKLVEYVVKIQLVSDDKRFHGGWMRAFSITHGEYYGVAKDKFWGAYCIMAGWTMGIIPMAIHTELTGHCPYTI
ncbi:MAG: hypothetical protein E7632_01105 [Ruminococcaceae bacterium]|nr:hypothetical protein [Oscillospiraceae bacterium]